MLKIIFITIGSFFLYWYIGFILLYILAYHGKLKYFEFDIKDKDDFLNIVLFSLVWPIWLIVEGLLLMPAIFKKLCLPFILIKAIIDYIREN